MKLAAALGSIVGRHAPLMFATAVAGAALAVWFMVWSGRVVETLRNTLSVTTFHLHTGSRFILKLIWVRQRVCACRTDLHSPPARCTGLRR